MRLHSGLGLFKKKINFPEIILQATQIHSQIKGINEGIKIY